MPLTKKHVKDICLWYASNFRTCKYCTQDELDPSKFYCLKQSSKKAIVDSEVKEYFKKMINSNQDPKKQGLPLGDNCQGYPIMKYLEQGYDKDQ